VTLLSVTISSTPSPRSQPLAGRRKKKDAWLDPLDLHEKASLKGRKVMQIHVPYEKDLGEEERLCGGVVGGGIELRLTYHKERRAACRTWFTIGGVKRGDLRLGFGQGVFAVQRFLR